MKKTYNGPVLLAQDLVCINVTPEQIVMRQAQTSLLHSTPPGPKEEGPPKLDPKDPGGSEDRKVCDGHDPAA